MTDGTQSSIRNLDVFAFEHHLTALQLIHPRSVNFPFHFQSTTSLHLFSQSFSEEMIERLDSDQRWQKVKYFGSVYAASLTSEQL